MPIKNRYIAREPSHDTNEIEALNMEQKTETDTLYRTWMDELKTEMEALNSKKMNELRAEMGTQNAELKTEIGTQNANKLDELKKNIEFLLVPMHRIVILSNMQYSLN